MNIITTHKLSGTSKRHDTHPIKDIPAKYTLSLTEEDIDRLYSGESVTSVNTDDSVIFTIEPELDAHSNNDISASATVQNTWIVTSDHLPEPGEFVFITTVKNDVLVAKYITADCVNPLIFTPGWVDTYGYTYGQKDILAWMPMPKPYELSYEHSIKTLQEFLKNYTDVDPQVISAIHYLLKRSKSLNSAYQWIKAHAEADEITVCDIISVLHKISDAPELTFEDIPKEIINTEDDEQ